MKTTNILSTILSAVLLLALAACSKNEEDYYYKQKMLAVSLKGYNGSGDVLDVTLDTCKYELQNGAFLLNQGYLFPDNQQSVKLKITERNTSKAVMEKVINREDVHTTINFLYLNGKVSDMPVKPDVEDKKLKLIYMFMPTVTNYTEPVDIVLGKYFVTPKVFEEITRIKNVKPYTFTEPVTLATFPTANQQYNGQPTAVQFNIYVYKAGTNEFYTEGTEYTSSPISSSAPKPPAATATSKLYIFSESAAGQTMRFNKTVEL
ncbi:hypothetical protein [Chitinophaga solisilvae]|nr:hypothetical protein [Chitinophaga solisilvae]